MNQFIKISFQSGPVPAQPSGQFPSGSGAGNGAAMQGSKARVGNSDKMALPQFFGG